MASNTVTRISVAVGAGATVAIQPAAKVAWEINQIGSDQAFVGDSPDVEIGMRKGATNAIIVIDPTIDAGNRTRQYKLLINNTVYLTVKNTAAGGANISVIGKLTNPFNVLSDILPIGIGATITLDPGSAYSMRIYEIGNSVWTAGPADINADVSVGMTDGALVASVILDPTMIRGHDKQLDLISSHDFQIYVTDTGGGGCDFAFSAEKIGNVRNMLDDIGNGDDLIVQPPDGEEWNVTEIGAETWVGLGAPDDYPDVRPALMVGANISHLMEAGTPSLMWNAPLDIRIDHDHYLVINNATGGDCEIAVCAYMAREYSP